jgi:phosphate transport system permease protein
MSEDELRTGATIERVRKGLARRYRRERRFRLYGVLAVGVALLSLVVLFADIIYKGHDAFMQTSMRLEVEYDPELLGISANPSPGELMSANYDAVVKAALRARFPDVSSRAEKRELNGLVGVAAGYELRRRLAEDPSLLGSAEEVWVLTHSRVDGFMKELGEFAPGVDNPWLSERQVGWVDELARNGEIEARFNRNFFTMGDSRDPETAGILGGIMGSFFTLLVTLALSFPIGVAAAIYLEEFAPKNRLTDLIEVNINNLAAVPSITFGLLGLAIFIQFFGLPRSAPIVGGLVLTLMTLPTIIIAGRAAIKAVPPSIRDAALGVGASRMQMVLHHVLPNALPGMLTGTIIGMAQALGETAPLIMIGMVAFIVEIPQGVFDPAAALPVQIYLWSDSPERGFVALTSAAIMVLLVFLVGMNALAVYLRKRLEKRW